MKSLEFFAIYPVFSLEEAVGAGLSTGGRAGTLDLLKYHLDTGRLKRVARGIYAVVAPGVGPKRFQPDPFIAASAVRPDGLFSHHAALELLGAAHSVWREVTLYTNRPHRPLALRSEVRFLHHPTALVACRDTFLGTRKVERQGRVLRATGPERTLVEGLRRPRLAGGLENLVASAAGFPVLDLDLVLHLLEVYATGVLWGAAGWFLETHKTAFAVPQSIFQRLEDRRPATPRYLLRDSRGGKFVRRWNLILPPGAESWSEPDAG